MGDTGDEWNQRKPFVGVKLLLYKTCHHNVKRSSVTSGREECRPVITGESETQDLQGHPWVNRVPRIAWWQKNSLRPTCERSQNNLIAIIRNNLISLHLTLTYTHSSNTPAYESINTEKRSDFDLRDMIRLKKNGNEQNETKWRPILATTEKVDVKDPFSISL